MITSIKHIVSGSHLPSLKKIVDEYLEVGYYILDVRLVNAEWHYHLQQDTIHLKSFKVINGTQIYFYTKKWRKYYFKFIDNDLYRTCSNFEAFAKVSDKYVYLFED